MIDLHGNASDNLPHLTAGRQALSRIVTGGLETHSNPNRLLFNYRYS